MTPPRAFTTLLTEALRRLSGSQRLPAKQWVERLSIPRNYSREEFDAFLRPILEEEAGRGNRSIHRDELIDRLREEGAVSRFRPTVDRGGTYDEMQRLDASSEANPRALLAMFRGDDKTKPIGPHWFDAVEQGGDRHLLPAWARMEDVEVVGEPGRHPMAVQVQSDQLTRLRKLQPLARRLAEREGTSVAEQIENASAMVRRAVATRHDLGKNRVYGYLTPEEEAMAREAMMGDETPWYHLENLARYDQRTPWDAANGAANYRPAIAMAIKESIDSGSDRLILPAPLTVKDIGDTTFEHGEIVSREVMKEAERMARAVDVKPEWEDVTVRGVRRYGLDPEDFMDPDEIAAAGGVQALRSVETHYPARALRLDKLKDKPLPILGAAITAAAGGAALAPSSASAQDVPRGTPDDPMGALDAAIKRAVATGGGASVNESDDEGRDWGRIAGIAAAVAAASFGATAIARRMIGKTPMPPTPPPIPTGGARRALSTTLPPTIPATAEQIQAMAAAASERNRLIDRLRSVSRPLSGAYTTPRQVDDIIANGPSYMKAMRPVDQDIADIQEALVRNGLVMGEGRVPDAEWVRLANEMVQKSGGEEFWLKNPDRVMASPELTAAAIAAQDNAAGFKAAILRSQDPTLTFEQQEFSRRVADEFLTRALSAQQRVTRDSSEIGRALHSLRLLGGVFKDNVTNGPAWVAMAERVAGRQLDDADAGAIVRLVMGGNYLGAAKKVNQLRKAHWLDKLDEGIRSAMQLTFLRPFRDLLGNSVNVADFAVAGQVGRLADMVMSVFTGKRTVMPPNILRQAGLIGRGYATGGMDALRLLLRQNVGDDAEFMRRVAERMDFTNETTFKHPVTNFLATQARRWFTAADYPAHRAAVNDALADMSMAKAYSMGHRGKNLAQAAATLFESPDPPLVIKAQAEAVERVWQHRNFASDAMHAGMAKADPVTRFVARRFMPFTHTPTSQIGQALAQSPVGVIKTLPEMMSVVGSVLKGQPDGEMQRKVARRLGLHATGIGWMALGWFMASRGSLQGSYDPTNRRENAANEEQNIPPLSIKHNGKWYALASVLGPQAILMAMGAGLHDGMMMLARAEAEDPTMEGRYAAQAATVALPMAGEAVGAIGDLPLAEGFRSAGQFGDAVRRGSASSGFGQYAGRLANQLIPAFVQQEAEMADTDAEGNVIRRDTRGANFSEAFGATVREAIPGLRNDLPARSTPFGNEGRTFEATPWSRVSPFRDSRNEREDWVTDALVEHDAFPVPPTRRPGESGAAYNERRRLEGAQEREALSRALQGEWEYGLEYASKKPYEALENAIAAEASAGAKPYSTPESRAALRAVLRSVTTNLRTRRTREQRRGEEEDAPDGV